MRRSGMVVIAAWVLAGCASSKPKPTAPLTQRQHDSVIGASRLPGATGVGGAMRLADSQVARNARLDSVSRQP
jgi:hypothetical protein